MTSLNLNTVTCETMLSNLCKSVSHVQMIFSKPHVVNLTDAVWWSLVSTRWLFRSPFPSELCDIFNFFFLNVILIHLFEEDVVVFPPTCPFLPVFLARVEHFTSSRCYSKLTLFPLFAYKHEIEYLHLFPCQTWHIAVLPLVSCKTFSPHVSN